MTPEQKARQEIDKQQVRRGPPRPGHRR
jgi:hypothetical protein